MGIKKGKILDFGPMRRAAEILGMKRTSLYARMRTLGMSTKRTEN